VCQVHTAVAALVRSWWLDDAATTPLLEQAAKEIEYTQARNQLARKCHTKTTRRKLRAAGIQLTKIRTCRWDTS
jgi:hypothetical protein